MRKDGGVFTGQPVKNFDRQLEFHRAWDVNESAGAGLGTMKGRKFCGPEGSWLGHEMFPHKALMLDQRTFQRLKNDSGFAQRIRQRVPLEQLIVGKDKAPRFAIENG